MLAVDEETKNQIFFRLT